MPDNSLRLLALDGGGVRGLSTLLILKRLMEMIDPESPPKPCDYFDMMGGTSTGGLIAIMLGRLEMTVDECIEAYVSLSSRIFQKCAHRVSITGRVQGRFDSDELKRAMKEMVAKKGLAEDPLLQGGSDAKCKVFVCATSGETRNIVRLTSYRSLRGRTRTVKIWEAGRATSAACSFFDPITIGEFEETFVDGATGANNPVYEVWNEAQDMWPAGSLEKKVQCLVSIGTGIQSLGQFGDSLIGIGESLKKIATETEKTAEQFARDKMMLHKDGRYYRFNVSCGLADIGLEEAKRKNEIAAATDLYIESQEVHKQLKACAMSMLGSSNDVRVYNVMDQFRAVARSMSNLEIQHSKEAGLRAVLRMHSSPVNAIAYSPDMKTIASGSVDGSLKIWEIGTEKLVREWNDGTGPVNAIAFSPDGKVLGTGSAGSIGRLTNIQSGNTHELQHVGSVNSIAFSIDGLFAVTGSSDKTVKMWSVKTGFLHRLLEGNTRAVRAVTFAERSTILSGGDDYTVRIWNSESGMVAREPLLRCSSGVTTIAYSPSTKATVVGCDNGKIRLCMNATSVKMAEWTEVGGHTGAVTAVAFSMEGQNIVSASIDGKVKLWYAGVGVLSLVKELKAHKGPVTSVAFSPDDKTVASASSDKTVKLWEI